jgi:hypothetical protein
MLSLATAQSQEAKMFKFRWLIAACALALTVGGAKATTYTFDWSFSGGVISGGGTLTATETAPGVYLVDTLQGEVCSINGCGVLPPMGVPNGLVLPGLFNFGPRL